MATTLVLSCDGEPLAEASRLPAEASAGAVLLARASPRLVQFYFGRGRRQIVVQDGDARWRGWITGTRRHPQGRLWYLQPAVD